MDRPLRLVLSICGFFAVSVGTLAQTVSPNALSTMTHAPIDSQAVPLIQKALGILNGAAAIKDVTLTGTATRTSGSDVETGSVTLKARGPYQSRLDLNLADGTWSEVRTINASGAPKGYWVGPDAATHPSRTHNILTDSAWFFPGLSILSQTANPSLAVSFVGLEDRDGISLQHIHFEFQYLKLPTDIEGRIARLTGMEVYLDPTSLLPVAVTFNTHPDNNDRIDIPVEIRYSNYQAVGDMRVPFHIQKLMNGTLFYDVNIQSANVNSGLSATDFPIQ